jgi:hypothetical protein
VVARGNLDGGHLGDSEGDGLSLGGHQNNLLTSLNTLLVAEKSGKHELSTVADGVDSGVLDDDTLVGGEKSLERADNTTKVGLVTGIVHDPLSVHNIVKSDDAIVLSHSSRADTTKLLHVSSNTQQQSQVNTEGTDVGSGLARDPEDTEVAVVVELEQLDLVDGSNTELTLDGRDKRGTLEESTSEGLESALDLLLGLDLVVETENADVLLSGSLLGLDETGGTVDTNDQTSSDLGVKGSGVTSLLTSTRISINAHIQRFLIGANLKIRLTQATTSWEEGLEGLSKLITPELM